MSKAAAQNLPQKLSDDILQFILRNHMKPGDKLPNETALSEHFNAGRSSVREAMKLLVSRNIVELRQGSGTYISEHMGVSDDPLGLVFVEKSPKLIMDLIEIRLLIEPTTAALAAHNADAEDLKKIMQFCSETEKGLENGENHARADILFHQAIARSSKNVVIPRLAPIISRTIETAAKLAPDDEWTKAVAGHREIAKAIAARNQIAAKDAMYLHLVQNRQMIFKALYREKSDAELAGA